MPEEESCQSRDARVCFKPISWDLIEEDLQLKCGASLNRLSWKQEVALASTFHSVGIQIE